MNTQKLIITLMVSSLTNSVVSAQVCETIGGGDGAHESSQGKFSIQEILDSAQQIAHRSTLEKWLDFKNARAYFVEAIVQDRDYSAVYVISNQKTGFSDLSNRLSPYHQFAVRFGTDGAPPTLELLAIDEKGGFVTAYPDQYTVFMREDTKCDQLRSYAQWMKIVNCFDEMGVALISALPDQIIEISRLDFIQSIEVDPHSYLVPFDFSTPLPLKEPFFEIDSFRTLTAELRKTNQITPKVSKLYRVNPYFPGQCLSKWLA